MKILIAYDSSAILRIQRYAILSGFPDAEVRFAETSGETLDVISSWQPDVLVADYHLPPTDGFQFLLTVRKRFPDLIVGYATAETSQEVEKRVRAAGAAFFVRIPFPYENLVAAVHEAVSARAA